MTPDELAVAYEERRFLLVLLTEDEIVTMLNGYRTGCFLVPVIRGDFPRDCVVDSVRYDVQYRAFLVCLVHKTFDSVAVGMLIPMAERWKMCAWELALAEPVEGVDGYERVTFKRPIMEHDNNASNSTGNRIG